MKSMLIGAAVAAAVTLPAFAGEGWVSQGPHSYNAHAVFIDDLVGNLTVAVRDGGQMTLQVNGARQRVDALTARLEDGELRIQGEGSDSVWDWKHWFDFSNPQYRRGDLQVHLTVPRGTDIRVENLIGDAQIGDTMGKMHFGAVSTNSTIGRVGPAHIELAGSGKVTVGDVNGDLHAETAGAGRIKTGNAHAVHAESAGSGSVEVGAVNGKLNIEIAGSGDFSAVRVDGPVHADIVGSGSVNIQGGEANPLHVEIAGSGNFNFGGTAVDPRVEAIGSGDVDLKAYRGSLKSEGMAHVRIGGKTVNTGKDDDDDN